MIKTNIILIGPMAAGKSTLGRKLAELLCCPFYDSDQVIEERTGVNIPWIFEQEGEAGFRKREHRVLDELTQHGPIVLATGGGAILWPQNRLLLKERGVVIYLQVSVSEQLKRVGRDPGKRRPLLASANPADVLKKLNADRAPLYEETAHHVIDVDRYRLHEIVDMIIDLMDLK